VPAIAVLVGQANWWPSRLPTHTPPPQAGSNGAVHHPPTSHNGKQTKIAGATSTAITLRS
jgi:uncharacterized membrane protein YdfJ with MMPL/SSD domain